MPTTDVQRIFDAAAVLGFDDPELRGGGHYCVVHPESGRKVFFPATPSEYRGIANVISEMERASGRKIPRQRGYSGGKRHSPAPRLNLHVRSDAEQHSADKRVELTERIQRIDEEVRDIVERIDLGRIPGGNRERRIIEGLLSVREDVAQHLRVHLGVVPELDIPGLDAHLSPAADTKPAAPQDLARLRDRFG